MNVVNRALSIVLLAGVAAAAGVTLGLVWDFLTLGAVRYAWPYPPVERITYDVAHLPQGTIYWVVGGSLVFGIIALALLVRDLLPPPRRARLLVLHGADAGKTEVPYTSLDELAERSAQEVAGVERVRARVKPMNKRRALTVSCRALVSPYADVATAATEVERTIAARLHTATGLPVRGVQVRATVQDERARRRVR